MEYCKKNIADFDKITKLVNHSKDDENLELLLSKLGTKRDSYLLNLPQESSETIDKYINDIEVEIVKLCTIDLLQSNGLPHTDFLKKLIKARKKTDPRLKIFSLNYDCVWEQAADYSGSVVIDGFSLSQKREFKGENYDLDIVIRENSRVHNEENFYENVFHLYKLHGSIDWYDNKETIIKREVAPIDETVSPSENQRPVLIYPNYSKFESTYKIPFFEMISRFQMNLRKQNTCLIIIGYSFNDDHINRIIQEAVKSNVNLETLIINPTIENEKLGLRKQIYHWIENGLEDAYLMADSFNNFSANIPDIPMDRMSSIRDEYFKNGK